MMRTVKRLEKPISLRKNEKKWTKELLEEIQRKPIGISYKYSRKDIKNQLKRMYSGLCCYCESNIELTACGNIEHRLPKKHFPEKTYDWNNMHWSCFRCNLNKKDWYDKENPILDSAKDRIEEHLTYNCYNRSPLTKRGENTIEKIDLNRIDLIYNRMILISHIRYLIQDLENVEIPLRKKKSVINILKGITKQGYCSLISYCLKNYMSEKII